MKSLKSQLVYGITFMAILVLAACGGENKKGKDSTTDQQKDVTKAEHVNIPAAESGEVSDMINAYLELKEALVNDDPATAYDAARHLNESVDHIIVEDFEEGTHTELKSLLSELNKLADKLLEVDGLKAQRSVFEPLSKNFRSILRLVGSDRTLYVQYCPMYDGNKGGYWLSEQADVFNPLFGSTMLNCGVTKIELSPQ